MHRIISLNSIPRATCIEIPTKQGENRNSNVAVYAKELLSHRTTHPSMHVYK